MLVLPGLVPLYSAVEIRTLDRLAVEEIGIPANVLMERAGMGAAAEIVQWFPDIQHITVVCGAGNNGGDGFVVARHLAATGRQVDIILVEPESKIRRESKVNLQVARKMGIPVERVTMTGWKKLLGSSGLVVDAMLGTGVTSAPRPHIEVAIKAIHDSMLPVVSLDVPTGVDATTGNIETVAVNADMTLTFHGPKIGLAVAPGRFCAGRVRVVDIGLPTQVEASPEVVLATPELMTMLPGKDRDGNKYTAGTVACIGGSVGMAGAVALSTQAAFRAGAGVVWGVVPEPIAVQLDCSIAEVQFQGVLADEQGRHTIASADRMEPVVKRADVVVFGPGLGDSDQTRALARWVSKTAQRLVLDAQGLAGFENDLGALAVRDGAETLLTPHAGELAILLGVSVDAIEGDRLESARKAAAMSRATILLKGEDTIVCDPSGACIISRSHRSMATAGSGDVVAGVAGALLAKGLSALHSGACAALICGLAAERSAGELSEVGVIASDIIARIPLVCTDPYGQDITG